MRGGIVKYIQQPISDILGDVEAKRDPEAPRRLAAQAAQVIWEWVHDQLPELIKKLDVQAMVERKVMAFSVERVEEILRNVIQHELNLIITTAYVLCGLIGACTSVLQKLLCL